MTSSTNEADVLAAINTSLMGEGARSAFSRDAEIGDSLTGTITSATRQQRRNKKGDPLYWLDQKPQTTSTDEPVWDSVLMVQVDEPDDEDDEGVRRLYVDAGVKAALRTVLRKAKVNGVEIGGRIEGLMLVGVDERQRRTYEADGYVPKAQVPKAKASL